MNDRVIQKNKSQQSTSTNHDLIKKLGFQVFKKPEASLKAETNQKLKMVHYIQNKKSTISENKDDHLKNDMKSSQKSSNQVESIEYLKNRNET